MNPFAYRTAVLAVKALSNLFKAKFRTHGEKNIPKGSVIFAINHFTRIETLFIPYLINQLTGMTIWSLADASLFTGGLGVWLDRLGAMSTQDPDRDLLMVKTLLTGEAAWIIFPEGSMVKNKKIYNAKGEKGEKFMIATPDGVHPPHTGVASLGLRTEFYRERIRKMRDSCPEEAERLKTLYELQTFARVMETETFIVPVNLTYYPLRGKENALSRLADLIIDDMSERMIEEFITEGSMLMSGVDVDMHFGRPIRVASYLKSKPVLADIASVRPIDFDDPIPSRPMLQKTALKIMERYMSAIYQMTTVNHDHLLATILKNLPHSRIDDQDLRRRVYLAATLNLDKMAINRHESLKENQIHLLTDDRYGKISNFIALATEKKVVEKQEETLKKAFDFSNNGDFHQVRVDNPVAVIANEIEPLTALSAQLESIARQPILRIKHQLRSYLINKALFDFKKDYSRFSLHSFRVKQFIKCIKRSFLFL